MKTYLEILKESITKELDEKQSYLDTGIWSKGVWDNGTFDGKLWKDGVWAKGIWKGSKWVTGKIYSTKFNDYVRSSVDPNQFNDLEKKCKKLDDLKNATK